MKRAYTFDAQTDQPSQKKQFPFELSAVFPKEMNCFSRFFFKACFERKSRARKTYFFKVVSPCWTGMTTKL